MSQKQAKGRKKGGDDNIKDVGNEWEGFKEIWMECGNYEFRCRVCMVKEMMKLRREIEDLKTKMACMKSIDEDICFIKIGAHANRYNWLLGSIYMNCEGIREENVLKMRCVKEVISKAKEDG